jgi:hypothetical protein
MSTELTPERKQALTRGGVLLAILDWVLAEQIAGRRPNDADVAQQFALTLEEATFIHDKLDEMGEFD